MTTLAVCPPYHQTVMDAFGGAPRFLSYPRTFTAKSGEDATLKCQIAGDPRPSVIWEKDRCLIHPSGRYRMLEDGTAYHLVISGVTMADSGQYICKARNGVGETYAAAALNVEGVEEVLEVDTDKRPRFLIKPVSLKVTKGDNVAFACKVWGQPSPTLHWEKDGKKLSDIFESAHFAVGSELEGWHYLKIHSARVPDEGVYVCRASNSFGESLAAAMLLVDRGIQKDGPCPNYPKNNFPLGPEPRSDRRQRGRHRHWLDSEPETRTLHQNGEAHLPSPKAKAFTVSEGKHAKFRCYVTGKPKPEIIWRKDGRVLNAGRRHLVYEDREGYFILKVLYCKQQDAGLYVCSASNTAGQTLSAVQLHVREPRLKFICQLEDLEVCEQSEAVLECQVPSESMPIAWYLEDQKLTPSKKYLMEEQGTVRRLTIRDTRTDDDGIYLCEMKGGGRSIAELAVIGPIVKRLPRKLDVLEGENAAFCVETDTATDEISWSKNGHDLEENHGTVLKSFGKTHILVLVNVNADDAGMVTFSTKDSQTSSQLRVKSAHHSAPSAPVATQMNKERTNSALLTWGPVTDPRHLPCTFVLERQELGSESWVQCFSTDSASTVEIVGDSVPREANYRFRICAINKYGRSAHVEFPGSVHLVPLAQVQTTLRDLQVNEGEDAEFSLELSTSVSGHWFLNGMQLGEDEEEYGGRCYIRHRRTLHTLLIRKVRQEESGAEITFVAYGIRDSAILQVQAPQVTIAQIPEEQCKKTVVSGEPVVLECEISNPDANVRWFKDGQELVARDPMYIQSDGRTRKLVISATCLLDSGTYTCDAVDDKLNFTVNVSAPQVTIMHIPEEQCKKAFVSGQPMVLECEVSSPEAHVCWFKDGKGMVSQDPIHIQSDGRTRKLAISFACPSDSGTYTCVAADGELSFTVNVSEPPVKIVNTNDSASHAYLASERVVLSCQLSQESAAVRWYKDGVELEESKEMHLEVDGVHRRLVITSACPQDSGEFVCDAGDDSVFYEVKVTEPPVKIVNTSDDASHTYLASEQVVLGCQLSRESATVRWYKDGVEVEETEGVHMEVDGVHRRLIITSAQLQDSGEFMCDAGDDSVFYEVKVTEPPVKIVNTSDDASHKYLASERVVLSCQLSRESAPVRWYKDGVELEETEDVHLEVDGVHRRLVITSARPQDSGEFMCDAGDDSVFFQVNVAEPPVKIVKTNHTASHKYLASERVVLSCQLSRESAHVRWYKDGTELEESEGLCLEVLGVHHRLVIVSARPQDTGEFVCDAGDDSVYFDVKVTEPPVKITYPISRHTELGFLTLEHVELRCEVSRTNAEVRWFKDGLEVDENENLRLKAEGLRRILILPHASLDDSGEYICDAGDDSVSFDVQVKEPAVKILFPSKDLPTIKLYAGEQLTLACELSRANAQVRWLRDGQEIREDGNILLHVDGTQRKLGIQSAGLEHSGKYVCNAADDSRLFVVQVSVLQDYPKGESFQKFQHSYITVTQTPVTLQAVGQQPKMPQEHHAIQSADTAGTKRRKKKKEPLVKIVGKGDLETRRQCLPSEDLKLSVTLSLASGEVKWFKDGEKIVDNKRIRLEENGATRSLVILGAKGRDSGEYLCDTRDDSCIFTVTVQEPPVVIVGNTGTPEHHCLEAFDDLVLACKLSRPNASVHWYKDGEKLLPGKRVRIEKRGAIRQITILGAQPADSGTYICDAIQDKMVTTVQVADPPIQFVNKEATKTPVEVVEGETITLTAQVSRETAVVHWLKNWCDVSCGERIQTSRDGTSRVLTIKHAELHDCGIFTCEAQDDDMHFAVKVKEGPVKFINKKEKPDDVLGLEGSSAVLSAVVSKELAVVTWTRHRQPIEFGDKYEMQHEGRVQSLVVKNLCKEDAGLYTCTMKDQQMQFDVKVKGLPVTFVRGLSDAQVVRGGSVVLWCELCKAKGDVMWMKDGQQIEPSRRHQMKADGRERSLTLLHVEPKDAGEYSCESKDDRTLATLTVEMPREVEIISELRNVTVLEGEDATFKCVVSPEDVNVAWQLDGKHLTPNSRQEVARNGLCHSLTIRQCWLSDAAIVSLEAEGLLTKARLNVQEAQVLFMKKLQNASVEEMEDVTLEVELNIDTAEVQWMKQGVVIQQGSKFTLGESGRRRTLTIHDVRSCDRGNYRCESLHDKTQAKLSVEARKVVLKKPLVDVDTIEREAATFQLELSHPNVEGVWAKGGLRLKSCNAYRISVSGCLHSLTISDLTLEDSGSIVFTADNIRSSARLMVKETPVTIVKEPQDVGVAETASASLECELSRAMADVKWFKDGKEIKPSPNCRIYSMGRRRFLQFNQCSLEDAGTYTCDAGECKASARLQVYEREVSIVKALEDVEIPEKDNAVFMCEVSHKEVEGEWYQNGEKIRSTNTVKIRQEGAKHFLLICDVKVEDAGEIMFLAKKAVSTVYLNVKEIPIRITKPLRDKTALARHRVILECKVSKPRASVRWFCGDAEIFPSEKYELCSEDCNQKLIIHDVATQDEATYTCDAGDDHTSAKLLVEDL